MSNNGINVLSLFDGMSCGQIALREAGIKVNKYFASEIDKFAIQQTQHNFQDTVQLGSVTGVRAAALREKEKAEPQPERKYGFDEFIGECYEPVRLAGTKKPRFTYDELVARANATKEKTKPRHIESHIQRNCFYWFGLQYPHLRPVFFAVPNGGGRNKREAGILKAEGVTAGVADAILLKPSGGYASLCVEFKTEEGTQRRTQKEWQKAAEANGNKYVIVRSFDDFKREITEYLGAV